MEVELTEKLKIERKEKAQIQKKFDKLEEMFEKSMKLNSVLKNELYIAKNDLELIENDFSS